MTCDKDHLLGIESKRIRRATTTGCCRDCGRLPTSRHCCGVAATQTRSSATRHRRTPGQLRFRVGRPTSDIQSAEFPSVYRTLRKARARTLFTKSSSERLSGLGAAGVSVAAWRLVDFAFEHDAEILGVLESGQT